MDPNLPICRYLDSLGNQRLLNRGARHFGVTCSELVLSAAIYCRCTEKCLNYHDPWALSTYPMAFTSFVDGFYTYHRNYKRQDLGDLECFRSTLWYWVGNSKPENDLRCVDITPTVGMTFQETVMLKGVPLRFSPWSVKSNG